MSLVFEALRRHDDTASPLQSTGSVLTKGASLRKSRLVSTLYWVLTGVLLGASYVVLHPYASEFIQAHSEQPSPADLSPTPEQKNQVTASVAALKTESPLIVEPLDIPEAPTVKTVVLPSVKRPIEKPTASQPKKIAQTQVSNVTKPVPQAQKQLVNSNQAIAEQVDQRQLLNRFNTAMSGGQTEQAAQLLEGARKKLGAEHLMVLRLQGYFCMQNNCNEQAQQAYQTLLAQLPNDKEAGYNLAVLEGRSGQLAQALVRVNQLLQHHPDDNALRALQQTLYQERR